MTTARSLSFALAVAGLACVVADVDDDGASDTEMIGPTDCSECNEEPSCDSHLGNDGECYCDPGHEWEDLNDPDNFGCVEIEPKPGMCDQPHNVMVGSECFCECGFSWCSDDPSDTTCCADESVECPSDTDASSSGSSDDSSSGTGSGSSSSSSSSSDTGSGSGSSG